MDRIYSARLHLFPWFADTVLCYLCNMESRLVDRSDGAEVSGDGNLGKYEVQIHRETYESLQLEFILKF